jgi:WD40 repeat protein
VSTLNPITDFLQPNEVLRQRYRIMNLVGKGDVVWSPNDVYIASGGFDRTVHVWNATTGNTISKYNGHSHFVSTVAWSPNGTEIVSGGFDETAQVWNAITGHTVFIYRGHSAWVFAVAWPPECKRIATGSADNTIQVWSAPLMP